MEGQMPPLAIYATGAHVCAYDKLLYLLTEVMHKVTCKSFI